jgi:nanoRNase/pAp phosphatase (c-di-AMP/oligoRNAs hydrolase)
MLKEVQMPPALLLGVVHPQPRALTLRTREPRALQELDPQIKPHTLAIKLDAHDPPRIAQPERSLKPTKILRLHKTAPIINDQKPVSQSARSDATHPQRGGASRGRCG